MKTLLLSTSSLWNCGDDFIRKGLLNLMRIRPDVRMLWWNRAYGSTDTYANDLDLNLRLSDYILLAGTPEWVLKNERIYEHCLAQGKPLSIIGVGLEGCVQNASQRRLLEKVAESGLAEVGLGRDSFAVHFLKDVGFQDVGLMPDPAFFMEPLPARNVNNILCWRNLDLRPYSLAGRVKRLARSMTQPIPPGYQYAPAANTAAYNEAMVAIFEQLPEPKFVTVHDNREIEPAEHLFDADVFYATDHDEMLRVYATCANYVGARIHGAIGALVHGASVNLFYANRKARVIEDSVDILAGHDPKVADGIHVHYLADTGFSPDKVTMAVLDKDALARALDAERQRIRERLLAAGQLRTFMQQDA